MSFLSADAKVTISSDPYNYMVIEEVFEASVASSLACLFKELIVEAKGIGKVGEVGELVYDALNFTPRLEHVRNTPISLFVSAEMREFISSAFSIRLDENVMIGMHRHNPPSRAGWAHTDFAVVSFPDSPPNITGNRVFFDGSGCNYADDSRERQPNAMKTARAIACLYYTANSEWADGMEGETGIFTDLGKRLVARVPPRNNSLFVFEISPISYHAFMGSSSLQRNSYIWWYHANPNYLLKRHAAAAQYKQGLNMDPWDRWTDPAVEKFPTQPE